MKLLYLLAGGAVLTAITAAAAPRILEKGTQKLRDTLSQFEYDPATGSIRHKDENVIVLDEEDFEVHEEHRE